VCSSRECYGTFNRNLTPTGLARMTKVEEFKYAIEYFDSWLTATKELEREYNVDLITLFYWEERVANWGTSAMIDKDIAQEDFVPFNCRALIETFESIDRKYNDKSDYLIFKLIIQELWPDLLACPVNPSMKHSIAFFLKKIGLIHPMRRISSKIHYLKNQLKEKSSEYHYQVEVE
jgi:hypothetical protein